MGLPEHGNPPRSPITELRRKVIYVDLHLTHILIKAASLIQLIPYMTCIDIASLPVLVRLSKWPFDK